jgi:ectoine hydrolase
MPHAFTADEYRQRAAKVRRRMAERQVDALIVADVANQLWLTGCEGWSFYLPQLVILRLEDEEPYWIGRAMDAPGARKTGYMKADRVHSYPERYVQRPDRHPCDHIGEFVAGLGLGNKRLGYESDAYFFSPKAQKRLEAALPNATFIDCDLLVNWERAVKSAAEIAYIRRGARLAEHAMRVAYEMIAPGVRQCDVVGEIYKAEISGDPEFSGDLTSLCPIILAGEAGSTAHPIWSEERFQRDQTTAIELAGACHRYHSALCRTLHLGKPPKEVTDIAKAVEEGLEAVLATVRAGISAHQAHEAWQKVLDRYGLKKESRIGYSIGLGYPPDWGEHTISIRAQESTVVPANAVLHVVLGMWAENWGLELSETLLVTERGADVITSFPRALHIKE